MARGKIVVVGAGIGGLTAAIALRRAAFEVEVHERTRNVEAVGAGITIQPNAVAALRRLDIGEAVEHAGRRLRGGGLFRHDGAPLTHLPAHVAEQIERELGAPTIGIHRATLHEILYDAAGRDRVHLGRACTGYEEEGSSVRVKFSGGSEVVCAALVAADGIHSTIRAQLLADGEPVYAGYTSWRGVTSDRCGLPEDWGAEIWGPSSRFGGCAIDGDRLYWFAVADAPPGEKEAPDEAKATLRRLFADFTPQIRDVIERTPDQAIFRTDIADRSPVTTWGKGRITLLGDAAHAMTPNLGQGACQAIEDALVLGMELAKDAPLVDALRAYEAIRQPRANAAVTLARRLGAMAQWQDPVLRWMRNTMLSLMPVRLTRKQLMQAWRLPY